MGWQKLSRYRSLSLALIAVAFVMLAVALPVAALHAGNSRFSRIVGWSTILAFSLGATGFLLMVADRKSRPELMSVEALDLAADRLAEQVLREEGVQRARLLGSDTVTITAANVAFDRADQLVEFEDASTGSRGDLNTIASFYQQDTSGRLVILGDPGSGKTVLALELLIRLLEQRREQRSNAAGAIRPVPVRLSLPSWNTDQPFSDWLSVQLTTRYGLTAQVVSDLVSSGRILPVLDGLDEMDSEKGPKTRAVAAVSQLNEYIAGASGAPLVITCRTADYAQITSSIWPAANICIRPLGAGQIIDYLRREIRDRDGQGAWHGWSGLIRELASPDDHRVLDLLQTPWRLVLAVTFYRGGGAPADLIPSAAERSVASESSRQHASRVGGILLDAFIPARTRLYGRGDYTPEQVTTWLANLAGYLRDRADEGLSGSDIVLSQCWPIVGKDRARRWHTATAAILALLTVTILFVLRNGGVYQSLSNVRYYLTSFPDLPRSFLLPGLVVAAGLIGEPWAAAHLARQTKDQPRLVNIQQLRTHQGRKKLATNVARWQPGGLAAGFVVWLLTALEYGSVSGGLAVALGRPLVFGSVFGFLLGLAAGLAPSQNAAAGDPRDALRSDLAAGLAMGFVIGLTVRLAGRFPGGLAGGLAGGLGGGLAAGLVGGLAFSSVTSCRYLVAVCIAASAQLLPLKFARFLHWSYRAGILRISGNAYQFRHTELREWLVRDEEAVE